MQDLFEEFFGIETENTLGIDQRRAYNIISSEFYNYFITGSAGSGKCVHGDTEISIRIKSTGEIKKVKIKDLM